MMRVEITATMLLRIFFESRAESIKIHNWPKKLRSAKPGQLEINYEYSIWMMETPRGPPSFTITPYSLVYHESRIQLFYFMKHKPNPSRIGVQENDIGGNTWPRSLNLRPYERGYHPEYKTKTAYQSLKSR